MTTQHALQHYALQQRLNCNHLSIDCIDDFMRYNISLTMLRVPTFELIKHLIVGGNVLAHIPKQGNMRVYGLNQYVCKRDGEGNLLEIVVKESVSVLSLDTEVSPII